jgi:hypothetical protein
MNDSVNCPDALIDEGALRVGEFAVREGSDVL